MTSRPVLQTPFGGALRGGSAASAKDPDRTIESRENRAPRIAIIRGDGIGVEVVGEALRLAEAIARRTGRPLDLDEWPYGSEHYLKTGETLPPARLGDLRENYQGILLGALGDPRVPAGEHARAILLGLRFGLDLYINFRPIRLLAPGHARLKRPDARIEIVVFRENTEGSYVGIGGFLRKGSPLEIAMEQDIASYEGTCRIIRAALAYARRTGRRRVCMADKSNAMPFVGDLWQRCWRTIGQDYPDLELCHRYVDTLCMDLVEAPEQFDVIVTSNMFGDIVSDLLAALVGGPGLAPSASINTQSGLGLFEPIHGSAPNIAGRGVANPMAAMLSLALLLEHLGWEGEARSVEAAVAHAVSIGHTTPDLGGSSSTADVGKLVVEETLRRLQ